MIRTVVTAALLVGVATLTHAAPPALTLYGNGTALLSETRMLELRQGGQRIVLTGLPKRTLPDSIMAAPGDPSVRLTERQWSGDFPSPQRLLERAVGSTVTLVRTNPATGRRETTSGELLSAEGGILLKSSEGIHLAPPGEVIIPSLPDGIVTTPTLSLQADSPRPQRSFPLRLTLLTEGVTHRIHYTLTVDEEKTDALLDAMVTIDNRCGTPVRDAVVTVVAGEPNRVTPPPPRFMKAMAREAPLDAAAPGEPEPAGEYHLYRLESPVTLGDGETRTYPLFAPRKVTVTRRYRVAPPAVSPYGPSPLPTGAVPVSSLVELVNTPPAGPGIPLPRGTVRIYSVRPDGTPLFLGEETLGPTPVAERVTLRVGTPFDLVAERKELSWKRTGNDTREYTVETTIRNRKKETVTVTVIEPLTGDSTLLFSSHRPARSDARSLEFELSVPAGESVTLQETIRTRI